jgi:beta-glucanase (GH16 family)
VQAQSAGPGWTLTFDDEFQGNTLDSGKWYAYDGYPNYWSANYGSTNLPSNVVVGNGVLQLITQQAPDGSITSGGISGHDIFCQQYGWFEARIKMPPGGGMWCAFWLEGEYANPAYKTYHEVDIVEWLGNRPSSAHTANWWFPNGDWSLWTGSDGWFTGPDFSADFHTYAINWQPDSITYYIDGVPRFQVTDPAAIPQQPEFILLTSGSGGYGSWGGAVDPSSLPNSMVVDYVRVWSGNGSSPPVYGQAPPSSNFTLSASPATVAPGGAVTVSWTAPSGQTSSKDWIALYPVGADAHSHLAWQYTGGGTSGSLTFAAPSSPGSYAFGYLLNDTYTSVATTPITVAGGSSIANLIQDPAFENQTATGGGPLVAPWDTAGPAGIGVDTRNGMNGSKCGYIYDGGSGSWTDIKQWISVQPNTNYTLSCFVQTDSAFPAQGCFGAQAPDGTALGWESYGQMTNYTQLTVTFNSGSNTSVLVYVGFTDQGPGAWIHVDSWSMK